MTPSPAKPPHLVPQRGAALRVEAGRRLVEEQQPRAVKQRQRQVQAALHPARVAAHLAIGGFGQPHPRQQLAPARLALALGQAVQRALQAHVLAPGQERVERGLLQRGADRAANLRALAHDVQPATRALPEVGGSNVVSTSTVVDLPAPLGPRKP